MNGCIVRELRHPEDREGWVDVLMDSAAHHALIDPDPIGLPWSEEYIRTEFDQIQPSDDGLMLVAEQDGRVVGVLSAVLRKQPLLGFSVYINMVSVLASRRGQGIGTHLMGVAEDWARERGATSMALDTLVTNDGARRLYERLRFRDRAVIMGKRLDPDPRLTGPAAPHP